MSRSTSDLIKMWQAAKDQAVGIGIKTDDRKTLQQQLYRARDLAGEGEFDMLMTSIPDNGDEIWIYHKNLDER